MYPGLCRLEHGGSLCIFDDGYTPDFPLFSFIHVFMIEQASGMDGTGECPFHAIRCHDIKSRDMSGILSGIGSRNMRCCLSLAD